MGTPTFLLRSPHPPRQVRVAQMVRGKRGAAARRRLVIMVKEPVAGRVKTRLAKGIGTVAATAFFRTQVASLAGRVGRDPRWETLLAVAPDTALASRALPRLPRIAQGLGDLGQRMRGVFRRAAPGPVLIIGADSPSVTAADIWDAFRALGQADAVLGPTPDGGYWLIGLRRLPRILEPFEGVRWSSATTRRDTLDNLAGVDVGMLRQLDDVDEASDLARIGGRHARRIR